MYPCQSCSGSLKDHYRKHGEIATFAYVEMLDSELVRNLFVKLQKDKRFECVIRKEKGKKLYDNNLPEGLRFTINFANPQGDKQKILEDYIHEVINEREIMNKSKERKKVDCICELMESFDVSEGSQIEFGFNNPNIIENDPSENFAISITNGRENKDLRKLQNSLNCEDNEFQLDDEKRCTIYGDEFFKMASRLRKAIYDYKTLERQKHIHTESSVGTRRKDIFLEEYKNAPAYDPTFFEFEANYFSPDDLMSFFSNNSQFDNSESEGR